MSENNEAPKSGEPPPLKPDNVLDSIFGEGGPMPTAPIRLRALAFLLDFVLLIAVASVIIWKVALPSSHPGTLHELKSWSEVYVEWYASKAGYPEASLEPAETILVLMTAGFFGYIPQDGPEASDRLKEGLAISNELRLLIFWLYFAIGEAFFGGVSLGKRICRIRSVSTATLSTPPALSGIVRGGLKTITLFWFFPLVLAATFISLFFNKRRQLAHDLFARTAVVDEKHVNLQVQK